MKPLKPGVKVTIPKFDGRKLIGTRRARAYPKVEGDSIPDDAYRALSTGHGPMWWFKLESEGITWCRGWSGAAVRALRVALVIG